MGTRKKKITIRDVAQLAGVSYQTVSRVMNDSTSVTGETRKRVVQAMQELDYSPNKIARMLTTNRSQTLELFIVDVLHGGRLADSVKNMARASKDAGYNLLISETSEDVLEEAFTSAASRLVDGIIMYAPRLNIHDEKLLEVSHELPLVRRDYVPASKLAWVGFDQVYATRLALEHLITLGHRQIAAIPPSSELINGHWRQTVMRRVLQEYGLKPGPCCAGDYSIRSAYEAMKQIFATGQPFTGLMVGTDTMALGAMRAIREQGLRIPEDISVISFDNAETAPYTEPPLTTVDFKFTQQDTLAIKYLIELLTDPTMELHQRILLPDLVIRASTMRPFSPEEQEGVPSSTQV